MTTYTWPTALRPASFEAQLVPNVRSFTSAYGGASQALDLLGERWRFALTLPPCLPADSGAREALFAKLRGGAHRVSLHHFGRPRPAGTLRGSPTLGATAAQGASSLTLAGCRGTNMLIGGGFDINGGVTGVAVGWAAYESGSVGVVARDQAAVTGGYVQRVFSTALAVAGRAGVGGASFSATPGQSYVISADVATGSGGVSIWMEVDWGDAGYVFISAANHAVTPTDGNWQRMSFEAVAPANAFVGTIYIWMEGTGAAASLFIDDAQAAQGAATEFTPTTLLAGDVLGLADGQLVMAADDATADDAGAMTVPLSTRLRAEVASGAAVTWNKPTAEFMLMDAAGVPIRHDPGMSQPLSVEFLEAW